MIEIYEAENKPRKMTLALSSTGNQCEQFKVDHEQNAILGAQVAMIGALPDRPLEFDRTTLDQVVALGNAAPGGVKTRFNHPTECVPGLGTFLGVRKNFRIDGNFARADLFFKPTKHTQSMIDHVMEMSEQEPDMLGNSIVVSVDREYRINEDGTRLTDAEGEPLPPLARVSKLWAVDVVDEPASGTGMFGIDSDEELLSKRARVEIRQLAENPSAAAKVFAYFSRFFGGVEDNEPEAADGEVPEANQEANAMEFKDLTLEALQRERPDLLKTLEPEKVNTAEFETKGADAERSRVTKILSKSEPCHFQATKEYPNGLAAHLIESGASIEEAYGLMWDASKNAAGQQQREDNSENLGIGGAPESRKPDDSTASAYKLAMKARIEQMKNLATAQ